MRGLVLATDGFEDSELSYPYYRLHESGWDVDIATPAGRPITGEYGYEFEGDLALTDRDPGSFAEAYDVLVVPGGDSPEALRTQAPEAADIVAAFDDHETPIISICHGAQLLISAGILDGRRATGYWPLQVDIENAGGEYVDEPVVVDGTLVTARVPDDLPAFMDAALRVVDADLDADPAAVRV